MGFPMESMPPQRACDHCGYKITAPPSTCPLRDYRKEARSLADRAWELIDRDGIRDTRWMGFSFIQCDNDEAYRIAKEDCEKALEIDPECKEALVQLGRAQWYLN